MKQLSLFSDRMELTGNSEIYFDRCRRLLECSDMLVQLELGGHKVAVWGHDLSASDYAAGGLHVTGRICAVEFDGGM